MLRKSASGIRGLDAITNGGLPAGRPTLLCGGPGSGKTMFAVSFLAEGALRAGEPGVLMSFNERPSEIAVNNSWLEADLPDLRRRKLIEIDYVHLDRQLVVEAGEFGLEGLFIRLGHAVDAIGARRVVLDSIDTLFASIPNEAVLRSELRRLFTWLKDRGLTAVVTAERGENGLTRNGIEEYVSDCVILLDHRVHDELATRRLRIVKYRGSPHGANEYPFLIGESGITLLLVTSLGLAHQISADRVSSGMPGLDAMLEGLGYRRGSSILVSGGPGTGKTSLGAHLACAMHAQGRRCLYFSFEESPSQIVYNMRSIGIDLQPAIDAGHLHVHSVRPTFLGLEMHLASMMLALQERLPDAIVVDPLSALQFTGTSAQSNMMVLRLVDYVKSLGITALYATVRDELDADDLNISSLMDTWISLMNRRREDDLERRVCILKSRGMAHSHAVRRFLITRQGIAIAPLDGAS